MERGKGTEQQEVARQLGKGFRLDSRNALIRSLIFRRLAYSVSTSFSSASWEKRGQPESLSEIDFLERRINNLQGLGCL
jgi:hypothetical protein